MRLRDFNAGWLFVIWTTMLTALQHLFKRISCSQVTFWSYRIAVREVEAWLMADRVAFADALGVRVSVIPTQPERSQTPN
jgi:hypothetical protein